MMKQSILNLVIMCSLVFGISTTTKAQLLRNGMPQNNPSQSGEIYRDRIQHFLINAENLFRQGNYLDALMQLDNAVEATPQNPEVYLHRALLKYRLGMDTEAAQDAAMAARLKPSAPAMFGINGPKEQLDLLAFYPNQLYQTVNWSQHLAYYQTEVDNWYASLKEDTVTDNFPELEAIIVHLETALEAMENQDWIVANKELDLLALFQANTSLVFDLEGLIFLETGALDKAATAFRQALQTKPSNALAWYNLSKISQIYGEQEVAIDCLNKAIGLNPNLDIAYFDRALIKKDLRDIQGAIIDYGKVISLDREMALTARFNRALSLKKIGKFSAALNDLDFITKYTLDNSLVWKVKGNIHLLSGSYNQAIADFSKAIELNSELGEAYFNRAIAHLLNYNALNACDDFERSAMEGYARGLEKQDFFCGN